MPRSRHPVPKRQWRVDIEAGLAAVVENELLNPVHGKPEYGARSALINGLLADWAERKGLYERKPNAAPVAT